MTKKKKPKDKLTGASPSNSSGSQFSDKASSDLAADPSDLRVLALSDSAVSPDKADEPSVEPTGAVTATIYDRAQQNPSFDLAIAALDIAHVSYVPSVEPSGAVTATISDSEPIGAVAATNPESEPTGAVTAGIPAPGYTGAVTDTTSDVVSVNPTSENVDAVTAILEEGEFVPPPSPSPTTDVSPPVPVENARLKEHSTRSQPREDNTGPGPKSPAEHWRRFVKSNTKKLEPEGTPFTLDSGEACVRIPNSVIEKNKKAWDSFILGQFYEEPPARGVVHAIVNGIWSKQRRDISVSKMDGHAFLFRVPCPHARRRILSQCLWQVDGQTMFVAKWSPGVQAEKPELSTVPVWLDFTGVPLQFFNPDALKEIAGLVGHPLRLHPSTENLTNLEVAKFYTVIDPRTPLPEAVNAQFDSSEVVRITVSSPWLPSLCGHCRKVGHTVSKCPNAPPKCDICGSVKHHASVCTRKQSSLRKDKAPIASQLPIVDIPPAKEPRPPPSILDKKNPSQETLPSSSRAPQKELTLSDKARLPNLNNLLTVDLSASGFISSGQSAQGSTDYATTSISDNFSEEDDNPQIEADRYLQVITRSMKKSARKARARGPLNL